MKQLLATTLLTWILGTVTLKAQDRRVNFRDNDKWSKVLKQAVKENKLIFLDGYTTWCGPCKMMDRDVFTRNKEADFFNSNFICAKYDMEKSEGITIKEKYGVNAFPTYLFIDNKENMVHKIVGAYMGEEEFIGYAKDALDDNHNYMALEKRYTSGERDGTFIFQYLRALRLANQNDKEKSIAEQYLSTLSHDELELEENWNVINYFLKDPFSEAFQYVVENQKKFIDKHSFNTVNDKIYQVYNNKIQEFSRYYGREGKIFHGDKEIELIEDLRKYDFKGNMELLSSLYMQKYQRLNDWEKYANMVDAIIQLNLLRDTEAPLKQIDGYATFFAHYINDNVLLKRALSWSEYASNTEKRPEHRTFYLNTKAELLAKIGDKQASELARKSAQEDDKKAEESGKKIHVMPAMKMTPMQPKGAN